MWQKLQHYNKSVFSWKSVLGIKYDTLIMIIFDYREKERGRRKRKNKTINDKECLNIYSIQHIVFNAMIKPRDNL